ncbi:MAG: hypothetical protein AB1626_03065 [Candidatus Micrarchaeota archaeon]
MVLLRIGFVDCMTNDADVFETATKAAGEVSPNVSLQRFTAPDVLKVPVCAKKLLAGGADVALAFLTLSEEDVDSFQLLLERAIDVELATEKFVFFCVVSRDEYRTKEQLAQVAERKLRAFIDLMVKLELNPSAVSGQIGSEINPDLAGLGAGMAAIFGAPKEEAPSASIVPGEPGSLFGEGGKPLF